MNNIAKNQGNKKLSLYDKNMKIHKNLLKVYCIGLFLGVAFIFIKDIFNV